MCSHFSIRDTKQTLLTVRLEYAWPEMSQNRCNSLENIATVNESSAFGSELHHLCSEQLTDSRLLSGWGWIIYPW